MGSERNAIRQRMHSGMIKGVNFKSHSLSWAAGCLFTVLVAFALRLLEWPAWQNPEYSYGGEMLLATHDAYHWLAGAAGFGRAVGHPMSVMLSGLSAITTLSPAFIAFWIPAVFGSLLAGAVFLWCRLCGGHGASIAAGLIASISPGFLGRTLLGFYDTDIITLLFPLLVALPPAMWLMKEYGHDCTMWGLVRHYPESGHANECPPFYLIALAAAGFLGWWAQEWHSVFPYIIRFDIVLLFIFIALTHGNKRERYAVGLCFVLPAVFGSWWLVWAALLLMFRHFRIAFPSSLYRLLLILLWCVAGMMILESDIYNALVRHINAYLKYSGEAHVSGSSSLIFPSVVQSIIETQDLAFAALFPYFHPWMEAAALGFIGYFFVCWKKPIALFLLPLAALAVLSSRMGGRMVMFGAPVVALGICLPAYWSLHWLMRKRHWARYSGPIVCLILCAVLVAPFLDMIPALSQGPALNRRHAAALAQAGAITPKDAVLWLWWDWGYAAHYFARRQTIADGALHGGPSLYLPAAVFATENPRFARQIIRRTSQVGNEPGDFFQNMSPQEAQDLLDALRNPATPLVRGHGRQFLVVSFEMLKLGFWISNYGNWNFVTCKTEGGALSIVPEAVDYRVKAGEVRLEGRPGIIFPASINIFAETGVIKEDYVAQWFAAHPDASPEEQKAWLASRRNINFLFNRVTDEKLAVDQGLYDSLMIQLLLCDAADPRFTPYFRLIYDNVFARIYEVLPFAEENEN